MKYLFSFFTAVFFLSLVATPTFASGDCPPSAYGAVYGGVTCPPSVGLTIDKKVQNPSTKDFVDNLGINDMRFGAEQNILFQLVVKNTGNKQLDQVIVKDVFPQFLSFTGGQGNFDENTRTISFEVDDLKSGESRTFTLSGKVVSAKKLPDEDVTCVINQAFATTNGVSTSDNASFCIQTTVTSKGGLPIFPPSQVSTTPATGAEMLTLLGFIPAAFAGYALRRKSNA